MKRTFLYAKLHQACVTHADMHYEGSFAIDTDILEAASILENEQIHIYNITNAQRFTTYAIKAPRGSCTIAANGACARLVMPGDRVIICAYIELESYEWPGFKPTVVFLNERNEVLEKEYV
jgi:aspartate 1-decarboxylase